MAGKWKIAKAFGRAVHGVNGKDNPVADAARKSYEKDLAAYRKNPDAAGRAEAFHRGSEEKWMDERSIVPDKEGRPSTRLEDESVADARNDIRMDENLQRDFDEAFERSYNRAETETKNAMEHMAYPEGPIRQETLDRLRASMIDDLKSGKPIKDVLDYYYNLDLF